MKRRQRPAPGLRIVVLGMMAAFTGACVHLQAPSVNLIDVELTDVQFDQQHFKVRLHVENPNDRPLPVKSISCTLEIQGVKVGEGKNAEPFTVPAKGEGEFDALVTTNVTKSASGLLPTLLASVLQHQDMLLDYEVSGWVNPDIALVPPIPFSHSGKITIPQSALNLSPGT